MLKLYAVNVWHRSEPRHCETIEFRTYSQQRAEALATESFPGCKAHTARVFMRGDWHEPSRDDEEPVRAVTEPNGSH